MDKNDEKRLIRLIAKWTSHFSHRVDFDKWKNKRIWQESYQEQMIGFLERIVPNLRHKKILDLGCGMGGFLVALKIKNFDVVGMDQNPDYCEIVKLRAKRYNLDVKVINSRAEHMPFHDGSFDLIVCRDVIEHVQNPAQVLNECRRILKDEGQIFINPINRFSCVDPHYHIRFLNWIPRIAGDFIAEKISRKDIRIFKDNQRLSNMHYFTMKKFESMTRQAGFLHSLNLSRNEMERKKTFFNKTPFLKSFFLNFYLSSWEYLITK